MTQVDAGGAAAREGLTSESLARDLRTLGVNPGQVLLVHASMRRIGWIQDGAAGVVAALREALGATGTLVVPTQTADNSDTSRLYLARTAGMTDEEITRFRAAMPPFDVQTTPATGMGRIAEEVRRTPGAVRSEHPQTSFAALGPLAGTLMAGHDPGCHLGESSPIGRLYEAGAWILLLGVGYDACCAFHLGEYLYTAKPPRRTYRYVTTEGGRAGWREAEDVVLDDSDFAALGAAFDMTGNPIPGRVGAGECRLASLKSAVDFAAEWLREHRRPTEHQPHQAPRPEGVLRGS